MKAGRFREDLFYRLHVFPISILPLRKRPEDISELARHSSSRIAAEQGKRVRGFDAATTLAQLAALPLAGQCPPARERNFPALVVLADGDYDRHDRTRSWRRSAGCAAGEPEQILIEASPDMAPAMPADALVTISDRMWRVCGPARQ